MTETIPAQVPVTTYLKGSTFVALERASKQAGTTVAVLVAVAADERAAALPTRQRYKRVTPELQQQIAELYAAGHRPAAIAKQIGCSRASVYAHLPKETP